MSDSTPTLDDAPAFLRRVASQIRTYSDMRGAERLERIAAALDASGNDERTSMEGEIAELRREAAMYRVLYERAKSPRPSRKKSAALTSSKTGDE